MKTNKIDIILGCEPTPEYMLSFYFEQRTKKEIIKRTLASVIGFLFICFLISIAFVCFVYSAASIFKIVNL